MRYPDYSPDEVEIRGEATYERQIRPMVEPGNAGKFVVIDIESGEYEIDDADLEATKRMLARRPRAILYGVRIGYPTAYTFGTLQEGVSNRLPQFFRTIRGVFARRRRGRIQ